MSCEVDRQELVEDWGLQESMAVVVDYLLEKSMEVYIQVSQFIYLCVANRLNFKGRGPVCVYHSILSEELAWRLLFVYSGLVAWLAPRSYEWNCTPTSPSRLMMAAYPV